MTACEKKGPQGPAGTDDNTNVGYYPFTLNLSSFYHYSTDIWGEPAPSIVPYIAENEAALVYVWLDPVDGAFEWVQQPFNHFYSTTNNNYNHFSHGIDDGKLWLYIRNSNGSQPYTTMSGTLYYKTFIIEGRMMEEMEAEGVDVRKIEQVASFLSDRNLLPAQARIELRTPQQP